MYWKEVASIFAAGVSALMTCTALVHMLHFASVKRKSRFVVCYMLTALMCGAILPAVFGPRNICAPVKFILLLGAAFFYSDDKPVMKASAAVSVLLCLLASRSLAFIVYGHGASGSLFADPASISGRYTSYTTCILLSGLFCFTFLYAAAILWNRILRKSRNRPMLWFVLFPISQILILWCGSTYITSLNGTAHQIEVLSLFSFIGFISDFVILAATKIILANCTAKQQSLLLRLQLDRQLEYNAQALKDAEAAAKLRDDMRAHLRMAYSLIDSGELNESKRQLDTLTLSITATDHVCENVVVDTVAREKMCSCSDIGISLDCDISVPENCSIDGMELCSIYSNIFDNAIAACRVYGDGAYIKLRSGIHGNYLVTRCENSAVRPHKSAHIININSNHGWGINILRDIAGRHDGKLETSYLDGKYITTLLVKL